MKKILLSLSAIALVAAVAIGATVAFFSDTEVSSGNTFTAGAIDLKVDSQCTYNGETSEECGTWGQENGGEDLTNQQFFNFSDIKPGDEGENTISLHVINNDAWLCAEVSGLTSEENGINEPEALADDSEDEGELDNTMVWKIWRDDGDNILEDGEDILAQGNPVNGVLAIYDSTTDTGALEGDTTAYLGVSWSLPAESGNETQTDSLTGDITFRAEQSRNNADFRCIPEQSITSNPS